MTEEPGCITRRFLTPAMHDVHALLTARMKALGMMVHTDAAGNLRGLWQPAKGSKQRLILGSHSDTVPHAGAYDGVLGITLALEWVQIAQETGFPLAVEIVAFSEEEGVRFGVPFIGSRAVAGRFDPALLALKDGEGVTVDAAIRAFGLDVARMSEAVADSSAFAFVEVHIEQGPVLEAEDLSVAAVTVFVRIGCQFGFARFVQAPTTTRSSNSPISRGTAIGLLVTTNTLRSVPLSAWRSATR